MNETNINWLRDAATATVSTNEPRIIGQLEALADKDQSATKMLHRYHSGREEWTVKKEYINISNAEGGG